MSYLALCHQCWAEVESRTPFSRPRPRTALPRTDPLEAKNRHAPGQGQEHRRKYFPKNKMVFKNFSGEKGLKNFFSGILQLRKTKKSLRKFSSKFLAFSNKILTVQKIVLSSRRGQGSFRGLEASRPRPRTSKCVLDDILEDSTAGVGR